jgi:hypothetical protein
MSQGSRKTFNSHQAHSRGKYENEQRSQLHEPYP